MKPFRKIKEFFKKKYVTLLVFYTVFLAHKLDKTIQRLGKMGVLDLSQPLLTLRAPSRPTTSSPQPTFENSLTKDRPRKQFHLPYVPAWVAASFKNRAKHPIANVKLGEHYLDVKHAVDTIKEEISTVDARTDEELVNDLLHMGNKE